MYPALQSLVSRLEQLSEQFRELKEGVQKAILVADLDPEMALTRARMCEILGMGYTELGADELFTVGLLSSADALLDRPLETIITELPLADELSSALLEKAGPAGRILEAVVAYELANFTAEAVQAHTAGVAMAYMDALRWAQETLAEFA